MRNGGKEEKKNLKIYKHSSQHYSSDGKIYNKILMNGFLQIQFLYFFTGMCLLLRNCVLPCSDTKFFSCWNDALGFMIEK